MLFLTRNSLGMAVVFLKTQWNLLKFQSSGTRGKREHGKENGRLGIEMILCDF